MKSAKRTMMIAMVLAVPYLAVGLLSSGPNAGRILRAGFVLLIVSAIAAAWMAWRGKRVDELQDERQDHILGQSMRFTFMVMAVAVQAYWSWQFAYFGNAGDTSFWLLVAFWASFTGAYLYNSVRS
jgi:uncharacterized membrane protein